MRIIGVDLHAGQQTIAMFYKRRCQGKHFPAEQRPSECSPRHRAPVTYERLFGLALAVCPMNSARRVQRRGYLVLPSPQFHLPDGDDASPPETDKRSGCLVATMVLSETRGL